MIHELKTWREPFQAVVAGLKTHEVRKADRPFQAGDVLRLREWLPTRRGAYPQTVGMDGSAGYTGLEVYVHVSHVTAPGTWGLPADVCVMSIQIMSPEQIELELGVEGVRRHQEQRNAPLRALLEAGGAKPDKHTACLSDCSANGCAGGCRT